MERRGPCVCIHVHVADCLGGGLRCSVLEDLVFMHLLCAFSQFLEFLVEDDQKDYGRNSRTVILL